MEKFQQYIKENPALVATFTLIEIVFIALIIFSVKGLFSDDYEHPSIEVPSLTQSISNLPDDASAPIEEALYLAVNLNSSSLGSTNKFEAKIVDNSLTNLYFEDINMHYVLFDVDLANIQQSYQIFYEWSDDNNNSNFINNYTTLVMCPTGEDIIYKDFNCKDEFNHFGQNFIVANFLQYFNFGNFGAYIDYDINPSEVKISPAAASVDEDTKKLYTDQVKEVISSLGISPELFKFSFVDSKDFTFDI